MAKDLYDVLGVSKTASDDDIRTRYRKLARELHPDVKPGDKNAEKRFKEINAAYAILQDKDKRKLYDEFGEAALRAGFDAAKAKELREAMRGGGFRGGRGGSPFPEDFDFSGFQGFSAGRGGFSRFGGEDMGGGVEDILGGLFGRRGARAPRGPSPGQDVEATLEVEFIRALQGGSTTVALEKPRACAECSGSGRASATGQCAECGGAGRVKAKTRGSARVERACPRCDGSGRQEGPCARCGGSGQGKGPETVDLKIPPGVKDGQRLRLAGLGGPGQSGGPPGDLYVKITVAPHAFYRREGDDLHVDVPVTVREAVLGAAIDLPTPAGTVTLKVPPGSQSGRKLRLKGLGAASKDGKGDLFARLVVQAPDVDAPARKELAEKLDRFYSGDVRKDLRL